ncbi:MAG: AmmeMemoRadiSam system radical SAM enzyme [Methanomassiliicoccales archaeon]|nr:AmmeMemoRadiSam system radical SAM enzyme [Methanomassiliicoccales archaeon]
MSTSGAEPKEALFWDREGEVIRCRLCPHSCLVSNGKKGICRVRENRGGKLYALSYGQVSSMHLDPLEKKPLFHFKPGKPVLSFGGISCNLRCQHCQNFTIAQVGLDELSLHFVPPKDIPRLCRQHDSEGVAWTYNEPTIWHEYVMDASRLCKEEGLFTVSVTNGYIQEEPLRSLKGLIDAMNIDVKGFTETFYHSVCQGQLAPVLKACETAKEMGVHVELTYLIIPTKNDRQEEIEGFCQWVRDSMGVETPVHFSRFHPDYKLGDLPHTPCSTMEMALNAGKAKGLEYVYVGNMTSEKGENTYCPGCGSLLIKRTGFEAKAVGVKNGLCEKCRRRTDIIW